jgi:hypothetical protein
MNVHRKNHGSLILNEKTCVTGLVQRNGFCPLPLELVDKTINLTNPYITVFHNGGDELMLTAKWHTKLKYLNEISQKSEKIKNAMGVC